jgi:hypothetical protein
MRYNVAPPLSAVVNPSPDVIITGRVTGSDGTPLENVSVVLKGSTTGVTTNANGLFSIILPMKKRCLYFHLSGSGCRKLK